MVTAVVGANWGDEGKGKITDLLADQADIVIRFQGGANAGHTIKNHYGKFALHTLPSGVFHPEVVNIIGNGVAISPKQIRKELEEITLHAMQPDPNERYQTIDDMLADLEDFRKGQTASIRTVVKEALAEEERPPRLQERDRQRCEWSTHTGCYGTPDCRP